jgi:hypothetical protein
MKNILTPNQKAFILLIILSSVSLFSFVFWLGFPGYFQEGDIYNSLAGVANNWHPIFIAKFVQFLYHSFGIHSFYLFALNLFSYYAGFAFFISALYLKFNTKLVILIFLTSLIGNIFFQNFTQYHSFTLSMLLWLGLSMVFFRILVPIKNSALNKLFILLISIVMIFALFWRHNAIISIYPFFILFIYIYLKQRNSNYFIHKYISLLFISAFILIAMVKFHPYLLSSKISNTTANHIFLHQIAGAAVPENDSSLIPEEWYENGKGFQDVKELYNKYPLHADPFNVDWEPWVSNRPFKDGEIKGLKLVWIKAITKYPTNYIKHISRYFKSMWLQKPGWIFDSDQIQIGPVHSWHRGVARHFPKNERKITFSPLQKNIYAFLFKNKILLNHIVGISLGFVIFLTTGFLWAFKHNYRSEILLFSFSTSLSACVSAVVFCIFTPAPDPRYMSPILVLSLVSLVSFITFLKNGSWLK